MSPRIATILLGSAATTLFAAPAFAQTDEDATAPRQEAVSVNEIVVTARLRQESLIDVPVPVSVATAEQLKRDKVFALNDLQRVTPALEISQTSGGEVNGGARLRGLGTGIFNASVSPSVAFVVDQVPQGNLTFPILFDLGQVEVLRGPQGTLFGQGASAGVINISTVAPTTDGFHASAAVDYADNGTLGSELGETTVRAALNVPLSDRAALRFAGQYRQEKGLQRNTYLGLDNDIQDYAFRVRALFEPSDDLTINISGEYTKQSMDGWNFFAIAVAPDPTTTMGVPSTANFLDPDGCNMPEIDERAKYYCEDNQARMRNQAGGISIRADWQVSESVHLTSVTAYRELDRETYSVNFSRRLGVAARSENIQSGSNQFSQELRANYASGPLDLIVGGMYSRYELKTTPIDNIGFGSPFPGSRTGFSVCLNAGFFCVVPTNFTFEDTSNETKAIFADATIKLGEQFNIFGGLRYSDYSNTTGVGIDSYSADRYSTVADKNLSGRIGASFKPSPGSTIFASYARGYKPPAIVVPTIATDPVTVLKPELADAFEIGAKTELGMLQISANAFYTKVRNFQVQNQDFDSSGSLISVTQNIEKVVSKGFEIGVMGQVTHFLSINAGYQFNDVRFPDGFIGNDGIDLSGKQFLNAPKHKLTLSGEGTAEIGGIEAFLNTNVVYKSKVLLGQYGSDDFRYPAHAIVNASIGLRDPDGVWTASLFARNLTKQREPSAYLASDFAGSSEGGIRAWPVAGLTARVVGVSLGFAY